MNKSLKAALLSALVFPGVGHFSLKKPIQGVLLSGVSIICLYFLITTSVDIAQQLIVKVQNGEIPMDVVKMSEIVSQQLEGSGGQRINIPSYLLMFCWIVGIIDSVRIGWSRGNSDDLLDKKL